MGGRNGRKFRYCEPEHGGKGNGMPKACKSVFAQGTAPSNGKNADQEPHMLQGEPDLSGGEGRHGLRIAQLILRYRRLNEDSRNARGRLQKGGPQAEQASNPNAEVGVVVLRGHDRSLSLNFARCLL